MKRLPVWLFLVTLGATFGSRPAFGQAARYYLGAGVGLMRLQGTVSSPGILQGPIESAMGRVSAWRFDLDLGYGEGTLKDHQGTVASRDLVEGIAMIGVRPVPWLSFKFGPHARGFVQNGITERWLFWEGHLRFDGFVAGPAIRGYLEVGTAVSGTTRNATAAFGNSRGGEVGLIARIPRTPVWLQLGYGAERSRLASATPLDAIERIIFGVGVGAEGRR